MIRILIVSSEKGFADALSASVTQENEIECLRADSGARGLEMIKEDNFQLIVADETLSDMTGIDFAEKVVSINPLLNQAVASSLSHADFHEASEGLGLLMALPLDPKKEDGDKLIKHLQRILQFTIETKPSIQ